MSKFPNWVKAELSIDTFSVVDETDTALKLIVNGTNEQWIPKNLPTTKPKQKYKAHEVMRKGEVPNIDNVANAMVQIPNRTRLKQLLIGQNEEDIDSLTDDEVVERIKVLEKRNIELLKRLATEPTFDEVVTARYEVDVNGAIKLDNNVKHLFSEDFKALDNLREIIGKDTFIKINENGKVKNFEAKAFIQRERLMANKHYATQRVLSDEDYNLFIYSSYFGCSPACIPYQGLKKGRDYWDSVIFPNAMALHPNCKHRLYPFIDGLSQEDMLGDEIRQESTKSDEKYQKEQIMRRNERAIRKQKYKVKALREVGLDTKAERLKLKNLKQRPHNENRI